MKSHLQSILTQFLKNLKWNTICLSNSTFGCVHKWTENRVTKRYLDAHVYSIQNSQKVETVQMFIDQMNV